LIAFSFQNSLNWTKCERIIIFLLVREFILCNSPFRWKNPVGFFSREPEWCLLMVWHTQLHHHCSTLL